MCFTKADAVFKHRVLWCAMADYISKGIVTNTISALKDMVLEERFPYYFGKLDYNSFLCTYARGCEHCPLQDITQDNCLGGLYKHFDSVYYIVGDYSEAAKIALKIALKIAFLPVIN